MAEFYTYAFEDERWIKEERHERGRRTACPEEERSVLKYL